MMKLNYRKLILLLADIFIITISGIVLNYILSIVSAISVDSSNELFYYSPLNPKGLLVFSLIVVLTCELMMLLFGSYSRMWRYFNIKDYLMCAAAMTLGFALGYGVLVLMRANPRKIFFALFFITATAGVLLFRFLFKSMFFLY